MKPSDMVRPKSLAELQEELEVGELPEWFWAGVLELDHAATLKAPGRIDLRLHHDATGKVNAVETRTKRRRNGAKP